MEYQGCINGHRRGQTNGWIRTCTGQRRRRRNNNSSARGGTAEFQRFPNRSQRRQGHGGRDERLYDATFQICLWDSEIAVAEGKRNRKLVIADDEGNPIREIVLPG